MHITTDREDGGHGADGRADHDDGERLHGCQEDDERNRAHDVDDDVKDAVDDRVLEQVAGAGAIEHHAEDQAEESADDEGDEHHGQGLANGFEQ